MKKIFTKSLGILILAGAILPAFAYADTPLLELRSSQSKLGMGEQFYVDVFLDPNGSNINGIMGKIDFPKDKISFVRAEDGPSFVRDWIERPAENGGIISFSGIIPNGFSGVIEKALDAEKKPGAIIRLVFVGTSPALVNITAENFIVTDNDGEGTSHDLQNVSTNIEVENRTNISSYNTQDRIKPEVTAYVTSDPNLYDGAHVLVFQAIDRESGIESVSLKENQGEWRNVESPYLLEDQSGKGIIKVQAKDFAGNVTVVTIRPPISVYVYVLLGILLIILGVLAYQYAHIYFYKKKKR